VANLSEIGHFWPGRSAFLILSPQKKGLFCRASPQKKGAQLLKTHGDLFLWVGEEEEALREALFGAVDEGDFAEEFLVGF